MKLSWFGTSSPAAEPQAETSPSTEALRLVDKDVDEGGEQEVDSVSQILRKTDVWFAYRIHELENQARELAASHASIGQPRHDQEHPGPLEVEVLLAKRGTEIILNWADRIRIKILGAMEREIESLGVALSEARQAIGDAVTARRSLDSDQEAAALEARTVRASTEQRSPRVVIGPHLSTWAAAVFLVLLVGADFFANLPVFVELLPTNSQSAGALTNWEAELLSGGLTASYGLRHLVQSIVTNPEPAILALSVIVFFLLLGHKAGEYLRHVVALSPIAAMRSHSRQAKVPLVMSIVGIALTVAFLFWARATVKPLAVERLARAEQTLADVNHEIDRLTKEGAEVDPGVFTRQISAGVDRDYRRERVDYGSTLTEVNKPILFLNLVLVIAAAMIGYTTAAGDFSSDDRQYESEERERQIYGVGASRGELMQRRNAAHDALRTVDRSLTRLRHLRGADVLRDFEAKKARIESAVALFRTENARLRTLHPADILAFRTAHAPHFGSPEELGIRFELPPEIADLQRDAQSLRQALERLDFGDLIGSRREVSPLESVA